MTPENGGTSPGAQGSSPTSTASSPTEDPIASNDVHTVVGTSTDPKKKKILKQEMVFVPAGEFRMGFAAHADAGPYDHLHREHQAATTAFWIDKYEVTNAMFKDFLESTAYRPRKPDRFLRHWRDGEIPDGAENEPVRFVSFEDAEAYAKWAQKRLPTQEEWEKAARGSDGRTYPWGSAPDLQKSRHVILGLDRSKDQPAEADSYPDGASPYGALHMEGNIMEWTTAQAGCVHPKAAEFDLILRRGIAPPGVSMLLCPDSRYLDVGFRCVRDEVPDSSGKSEDKR